jgi:hypothetical protein
MQTREENFMTNRFLISAAVAALIAGTGFANAQGTGTNRETPSAGSNVQQNAPSSERGGTASGTMHRDSGTTGMKGAESTKGSDSKDMKASESHDKQPSSKSAQDTKGEKSKSLSSENETKGGKDMKAEGRDKSGNMNAETKGAADSKSGNMNAQTKNPADKSGNMNAQTQSPANAQSQTTTGNAATSATAAPPAEKQTQIASAIKSERIQETTNVNFNISVGAVVPASVRFHPLPARIVEIYPQWRGYEVILVHGRYIIVRPQTHEIVYIIEG